MWRHLKYFFHIQWQQGLIGWGGALGSLVTSAILGVLGFVFEARELLWIGAAVAFTVGSIVAMAVLTAHALELAELRVPSLSVVFVPGGLPYEATQPKHATGPAHRLFRIMIKNTGGQPLSGCAVKLVRLLDANDHDTREPPTRRFRLAADRPINPATSGHRQDFNLAPGDYEMVDIAEMDEVTDPKRFFLCYAAQPEGREPWGKMPIEKGPHLLVIRVVGAPQPTIRIFELGQRDGRFSMADLGDDANRPDLRHGGLRRLTDRQI